MPPLVISQTPGAAPSAQVVISRPISSLIADPRNARLHSKRQVRQTAESIKAFGFNVPVLIDREGKVVAGHGRLEACKLLGWAEVPTISLEHLPAPSGSPSWPLISPRLSCRDGSHHHSRMSASCVSPSCRPTGRPRDNCSGSSLATEPYPPDIKAETGPNHVRASGYSMALEHPKRTRSFGARDWRPIGARFAISAPLQTA